MGIVRASTRWLALAALLLACAPAGASAFSKAIWGPLERGGVSQFPMYKSLGVSIYEADLWWSNVATRRPVNPTDPNDPAYHWPDDLGRAMAAANRFHIRVLLQVIQAPGWANGGRSTNWAPTHVGDYAAFVTAAARRYPGVHLWMIWGEPTRRQNFQPLTPAPPQGKLNAAQQLAPHTYARILDSAYVALKRVSPRNLVIGGCTYTAGEIRTEQWIRNLRLPSGRVPRMDIYAHNPFSWQAPNFSRPPSPNGTVQFSDLPRLATWIDRYLHRPLPIFLSEWTIPTRHDGQFNFWVDPPVAAQWITRALAMARSWRRIYGLGWINVYDTPPVSYGGLLTAGGDRKPSFYAFAR
ncbi:MAG: hypothetical protein ACJ76X_07060 [Solirubrobacteraceae bacterium]